MQKRWHALPFRQGLLELEHLVLKGTDFFRYEHELCVARELDQNAIKYIEAKRVLHTS